MLLTDDLFLATSRADMEKRLSAID